MAYNFLQSCRLLADAWVSSDPTTWWSASRRGRQHQGQPRAQPDAGDGVKEHIGYDKAAKIAKTAHANGTTLREEAVGGGR